MTSETFVVWSGTNDWAGRYASTREDFDEAADRFSADYLAGRISLSTFEAKLDGLKDQIHRSLERRAA